ncbi:hypothetical protein R69619_00196 [Paraburkholderia nemoris]|uniref:DUF2964 family protein n=1 Tax=Paraburkholderia nemoris TaxID=2793076 RepID=UPI0019098721|nr:DUF2964 family protein [Paraburkholderia nemoris]MBK3739025.1 DUF2964 family protein [Paraburkholderia aspalathi]CAE6690102.1 hypothetical protein R69619_00196 [Paraburkholderia nemoris]
MVRTESRIIFATVAVFIALASLAGLIRGLLFDSTDFIRFGAAGLVAGVACFVLLLNPSAGDDS